MSLLLDALRKSANQRRLGQAPALDEGLRQPAAPGAPRRRWLTPVLLLLIVIVVAVAQPWRGPEEADDALLADEAAPAMDRPVANRSGGADRDETAIAPGQRRQSPAVNAGRPRGSRLTDASDEAARQAARDAYLDQLEQSEVLIDAVTPPLPDDEYYADDEFPEEPELNAMLDEMADMLPTEEELAMINTPRMLPNAFTDEDAEDYDEPETNAEAAAVDEDADEAPPPATATTADAAVLPGADGLKILSYYDLPPQVRTGMPEIDVQIRVYDEDPAKRFVVAGRTRYREGDALTDGVGLREIRRDGVVLAYRNYLFLWDKR